MTRPPKPLYCSAVPWGARTPAKHGRGTGSLGPISFRRCPHPRGDGSSKTWTEMFPAHSPSPRQATVAYDEASRQVMLFGGCTAQYSYFGDTWTYDGVDWTQQEPASVPPARCDEALSFDPELHAVVMFGGLAGPCEDCGDGRLNDTWLWGGKNWTQVQTPKVPSPSSGTSFGYNPTVNGMLLFGGWVGPSSFTSATWLFGLL